MFLDSVLQVIEAWLFAHPLREIAIITAAAYAVNALLLLTAGFSYTQSSSRRRICRFLAFVLLIMALNTLFKVADFVLLFARDLAQENGVYQQRRAWQFQVILIGMALVMGWLAWMRSVLSDNWFSYGTVVLGVTGLFSLTLLQAISFHYVDAVLYSRWMGASLRKLMEVSGLCITFIGALHLRRIL